MVGACTMRPSVNIFTQNNTCIVGLLKDTLLSGLYILFTGWLSQRLKHPCGLYIGQAQIGLVDLISLLENLKKILELYFLYVNFIITGLFLISSKLREKSKKKIGPCSICFVIKSLLMIKKTKKIVCLSICCGLVFSVRGARKSVEIGIGVRGWNSACVKF
jgi:hypothetical protein